MPDVAQLQLDTPVQYVKGVGPVRAGQLKKLGVETVEDLLSDPKMFFPGGVRRVNDVEHEVRVGGLFERRTKWRHQIVGQFSNEAHRVGQHRGDVFAQRNPARTWIEGGKEAIFDHDLGPGQTAEEG